MKTFKFRISAIIFLVTIAGYSQSKITGTVMNSKNKPVANALVYLDSINSEVKTDKKGYYSVEVPKGTKDINIYSYKYGLLSTEIGEDQIINFKYLNKRKAKKDGIKKGDKVAMAYSETEEKYLAQNLSVLEPEKEMKDLINYQNIYDLIRGRVSGVVVTKDNRIRIRGVNSPNSSSEPLFVVDGTPVFTIGNILPVNVKDIKVLKGPDAAIYGTRGSNGVILITTKS